MNVWDVGPDSEKNIRFDSRNPNLVVGASFNKLVERVTSERDHGVCVCVTVCACANMIKRVCVHHSVFVLHTPIYVYVPHCDTVIILMQTWSLSKPSSTPISRLPHQKDYSISSLSATML